MKISSIFPLLSLCFTGHFANASTFKEAQVTQVVKEVSIQRPALRNVPASIGDQVTGTTAVKTGLKSRAELAFPDRSLLRLGANTRFSFLGKDRDFNLHQGTAVFKTNKKSGGARFHFGGVTAAITGSMATVATPPEGRAGHVFLMLYYGSAYLEVGGVPYPLLPWQMAVVPVDANGNPNGPVKIHYFDAALAATTSNLMDPKEEGLKENLARTKNELSSHGIVVVPDSLGASDHIVSRATSQPGGHDSKRYPDY